MSGNTICPLYDHFVSTVKRTHKNVSVGFSVSLLECEHWFYPKTYQVCVSRFPVKGLLIFNITSSL
jgi:hypothetical protein